MSEHEPKKPWARSPEREDPAAAGRRAAKLLLLGGGAGLLAGGVQLGTTGPPRILRSVGVRFTQVAGGMRAPPPPPWVAGALTQLQVEGAQAIAPGEQYQLRVVGVGANYCSTDVTSSATYKSLEPDVATVSSSGLVTAVDQGTATIVVTYADPVGNVVHSGSHPLCVRPRGNEGSLSSISIAPYGRDQVPVGALQLVVQGYDGAGVGLDLTRLVTWKITPADAATIDETTGLLQLLRPGRVNVTATMGRLTTTSSYTVVERDAGGLLEEACEVEAPPSDCGGGPVGQ